jgi:phenylacetyl-CoA:acceptor oxidoreductase subunit 1
MTRFVMVADLNRCVGCQTCTAACKQTNTTAPGIQWRKVLDFEAGEYPNVTRAFVPVGCMHCDEPPCMDVCPSTATQKRDDGIVSIDYSICIGCSYCAVACPYQARYRVDTQNEAYGHHKAMEHEVVRENWDRRAVAQKCTFCIERLDPTIAMGKIPGVDQEATPSCVNSCIAGALHFGDSDDPDSNVSTLLKENRHSVMHEELGTGPAIHYLWQRGGDETDQIESPVMLEDTVGLDAVSPKLQTQWDWRAAANFIFGGTGTGLFATAMAAGLLAPIWWPAVFAALVLVGLGLFCVWLEIGRPWRFLNVFRHPARSWMTREAIIAVVFFCTGALAWLLSSWPLGILSAVTGLAFLYCQGRILNAAKGIPVWRQDEIVPLIIITGMTEGVGLFSSFFVLLMPQNTIVYALSALLITLLTARSLAWWNYRRALGSAGAPTLAFEALDSGIINFAYGGQLIIIIIAAIGFVYPPALIVAGLMAMLTGWGFKFTLITKAAFNQGYAINRMPARGSGESTRGVKPGWMVS